MKFIRIEEAPNGRYIQVSGTYRSELDALTDNLIIEIAPESIVVPQAAFYGYEDQYRLEDADGVENA